LDLNPIPEFMSKNISFPLGGLAIIDKVEKDYAFFSKLFRGLDLKMRDFIPYTKLHIFNKLSYCVSVNQILNTYPIELMGRLGFQHEPKDRSLYRSIETIGKNFQVLLYNYQEFIKDNNLVDENQLVDFTSTYFEGNKAEIAKQGYSRDHRPDRPQVNFGISTGINNIPTALTIQNGNTQDKKHMGFMLKILPKVMPEGSLFIFDAGANTTRNKAKICELKYHYLTFRAKRISSYKSHIQYFQEHRDEVMKVEINERSYYSLKRSNGSETLYIYFSPELYSDQIGIKERKFERQKEKGNKILKRRKRERIPSDKGWVEMIPSLQTTLYSIDNPYITGIEGYFILESSVSDDPIKILKLYKSRDRAEKFIRSLKEGLDLRPIRHWNTWCIYGILFLSFIANFLINLTLLLRKKPECGAGKNVKLLKKYLNNLTLTVVYPKNGFRFHIISNISLEITRILGEFIKKYEDKSLKIRW
jgi:transposase